MLKKIFFLVGILAVTACTSSQGFTPANITEADKKTMDRAFMVSLADPKSAQTSGIQVFQAPNGNRLICGQLNAKNAFGGFIGFQTFEVMTVASVDYSKPYVRPIFATGATAAIDCGGAGYTPPA
ncbi:hypothetical protein [Sulfitobacter sp. EhC04]|uniref:hypothetical protein n=1 Tax=Sulfitobacter sp. EhC04 TaxID=1849168 RepID=UPI0010FF3002|nr:hypothetical protein [Sulfitobacter sp. EhC04]